MFKYYVFSYIFLWPYFCFSGWSSNGGSSLKDQDNPWYLGDQVINYCILRSDDYPLSQKELEIFVLKGFEKWKIFLENYKLNQLTIGDGQYIGKFKDRKSRKLSTKFEYKAKCEDSNVKELHFYFGIKNKLIESVINLGLQHPVGVAIREDYDHLNYQNEGFIWVKNFSQNSERVFHVLLHEMGHLFGMKHNSVYVMDEKVADEIEKLSDFSILSLGEIETPNWKYHLNPNEEYELTFGSSADKSVPHGFRSNSSIPEILRSSLGFSREGYFSAKLIYKRYANEIRNYFYELELEEFKGKKYREMTLVLSTMNNLEMRSMVSGIFTKWFDKFGNELGFFEQSIEPNPKPRSFIGSIVINGKKYGAMLNNERGIILRVFVTSSDSWWEVK